MAFCFAPTTVAHDRHRAPSRRHPPRRSSARQRIRVQSSSDPPPPPPAPEPTSEPENLHLIAERDRRRDKPYKLKPGDVAVRFVNSPADEDIVVTARAGTNLLDIGDAAGVRIPRGCRTGLCGTCTSDIEDPGFPDAKQTIRACCTEVVAPPEGCTEFVVDLYRMDRGPLAVRVNNQFQDLDTKYVAGAAPRTRTRRGGVQGMLREKDCDACVGRGRILCVECEGSGRHPDDESYPCLICMGLRNTRCAECQGKGILKY